jgi:hypothetical protein
LSDVPKTRFNRYSDVLRTTLTAWEIPIRRI